MNSLIFALAQLTHTIISLYILVIIVSAILSFVRPDPYNPLVQIIYRLTEPVFNFIRRTFPFVVFSGIDLSPLVILLALQFFDNFMMSAITGM